jgi:hypothetical protein
MSRNLKNKERLKTAKTRHTQGRTTSHEGLLNLTEPNLDSRFRPISSWRGCFFRVFILIFILGLWLLCLFGLIPWSPRFPRRRDLLLPTHHDTHLPVLLDRPQCYIRHLRLLLHPRSFVDDGHTLYKLFLVSNLYHHCVGHKPYFSYRCGYRDKEDALWDI